MKSAFNGFIVLLIVLMIACSKESEDPPDREENPIEKEDKEDIITSMDIGPFGGELQVQDESGNVITVSFPPGAVMDTTSVTLTLLGKYKELPVDERQLRAFEIVPKDLSLYEPVVITIEYDMLMDEIEHAALYCMQSITWLTPLMNHDYNVAKSSLSASTLKLGEFAEGKMTLEQVITQFDLLKENLGIEWSSAEKSAKLNETIYLGGSSHKKTWDDHKAFAGTVLKILELLELKKFYEDPPDGSTLEEDIKKICDKILRPGVEEVLEKGLPEDPCSLDYTRTLGNMMADMSVHGCVENKEFEALKERYHQMLRDCQSFLSITTVLNIEEQGGSMKIESTGVAELVLTGHSGSLYVVEGNGTLHVSGDATSGDDDVCTSTISGVTLVEVSGTRDPAYTYALDVYSEQNAMMTTVCPRVPQLITPMLGSGSRYINLSKSNNFTISRIEQVPNGTLQVDIQLDNPYTPLPESSQ